MMGRNPKSKPLSRTDLLRWLGTLLAVVLLIYLLSQQGWEAILVAARKMTLSQLVIAFALMLASRFAVSARWYKLLISPGARITFGQTVKVTFAGLFATNFLPTTIGGDVVRLAGVIRLGEDAAIATASLIADRLVGMAGMALALPFVIPGFARIVTTSFLAMGLSVHAPPASDETAGPKSSMGWLDKTRLFLRQIVAALSIYLKKPVSLLWSFFYTAVHMLCFFGILYVLFAALGEPVPFWQVVGLYSLVYFITLLPFSINGYGLQEVSLAVIFSRLAGVSLEVGITAALIFRTLTMIASLPGALFISEIMAGVNKTNSPAVDSIANQ